MYINGMRDQIFDFIGASSSIFLKFTFYTYI